MGTTEKPTTDRFMSNLESLRLAHADENQARNRASLLYPSERASDKSNRSLFMRVFKAPQKDFEAALFRWKNQQANFTEIAAGVPRIGTSGAKPGNLNATAGRTKSRTLKDCQSAWRALSEEDRKVFLQENGLAYIEV